MAARDYRYFLSHYWVLVPAIPLGPETLLSLSTRSTFTCFLHGHGEDPVALDPGPDPRTIGPNRGAEAKKAHENCDAIHGAPLCVVLQLPPRNPLTSRVSSRSIAGVHLGVGRSAGVGWVSHTTVFTEVEMRQVPALTTTLMSPLGQKPPCTDSIANVRKATRDPQARCVTAVRAPGCRRRSTKSQAYRAAC